MLRTAVKIGLSLDLKSLLEELDLLRRNGWKGHGPVPWEHEPNRGFLRALAALGQAAASVLGAHVLGHRVDLRVRDPRSLHTDRLGCPHRQEEPVALTDEFLRPWLVQDHSGIRHRRGREGQT